jgi:AcrR family transcriptional regulator
MGLLDRGGAVGGHHLHECGNRMQTESRAVKRARYIEAARQILERNGLDALTMQALANEVGAAVGTIYGYFPSKSALVAELQLQAIGTIIEAWHDARSVWTEALRDRLTHAELALAEVVAFGEFFLAIQVDYALEFDLNRTHLDDGRELFETVDFSVIRPSVSELVEGPVEVVRASIEAGALRADPDAVRERVLMLLLGLYGVSLLSVPRPGTERTLVPELSRLMVRDLALGWGADAGALERVTPLVRAVVAEHPLASLAADDRLLAVSVG